MSSYPKSICKESFNWSVTISSGTHVEKAWTERWIAVKRFGTQQHGIGKT